MNIAKILSIIRPGAEYTIHANDYERLEWLDTTQIKPSLKEIEDGQKQLDALAYREKRAAEYPPVGDQLDALWKGGADAAAMKATIESIKAKYPKGA
jgi:hypothetical protein